MLHCNINYSSLPQLFANYYCYILSGSAFSVAVQIRSNLFAGDAHCKTKLVVKRQDHETNFDGYTKNNNLIKMF